MLNYKNSINSFIIKKKTLNKKYICLIPARAGSKRVPNKNIKELNSKPLLQHSIDFAKEIFNAKDIYLSTDSDKALEIGNAKFSISIFLELGSQE